uniref:C2H2-type domain-containing protein n=1 Tax=Rhabditophanes sp. KR3021 TaxID=114890 RepID=A0AC35TJD7_9BILA
MNASYDCEASQALPVTQAPGFKQASTYLRNSSCVKNTSSGFKASTYVFMHSNTTGLIDPRIVSTVKSMETNHKYAKYDKLLKASFDKIRPHVQLMPKMTELSMRAFSRSEFEKKMNQPINPLEKENCDVLHMRFNLPYNKHEWFLYDQRVEQVPAMYLSHEKLRGSKFFFQEWKNIKAFLSKLEKPAVLIANHGVCFDFVVFLSEMLRHDLIDPNSELRIMDEFKQSIPGLYFIDSLFAFKDLEYYFTREVHKLSNMNESSNQDTKFDHVSKTFCSFAIKQRFGAFYDDQLMLISPDKPTERPHDMYHLQKTIFNTDLSLMRAAENTQMLLKICLAYGNGFVNYTDNNNEHGEHQLNSDYINGGPPDLVDQKELHDRMQRQQQDQDAETDDMLLMELEHLPREEAFAEIVMGEDGQMYIVTLEDAPEIDMNCISSIQVVTNEQQAVEHIVIIDEGLMYPPNEGPFFQIQENCYEEDFVPGQSRARTVMTRDDGSLEVVYIDEDCNYTANQLRRIEEDSPLNITSKSRRNRVEGSCHCPECGQSFINTARLERHLSVHQVFGSFQCPLCQKGYKYEYNLFYHWRKTCRDLHDIMDSEERRTCDVNQLRKVVETLASRKHKHLPEHSTTRGVQVYSSGNAYAALREASLHCVKGKIDCRACGIPVYPTHFARHLSLHKGDGLVDVRRNYDTKTGSSGFFCDLCGMSFKHHHNLIKHWRTNCPTIQTGFEEGYIDHFTMDNDNLKKMVTNLLKRVVSTTMLREMETEYSQLRNPNSIIGDVSFNGDILFHDHLFDPNAAEMYGEIDPATAKYSKDGTFATLFAANPPSSVQCPECFRSFASQQRLDRHMQGFHRGEGTHHCVLCGHRFKFDYSLLYHYRKSCQFSLIHVEQAVREQSSASELKKLVRELAVKIINDEPKMPSVPMKDVVEDESRIHREMMRFSLPNESHIPPPLTMQNKDLENSSACPVCLVKFFGERTLEMHMRNAHKSHFDASTTYSGASSSAKTKSIDQPEIITKRDGGAAAPVRRLTNNRDPDRPPSLENETVIKEDVIEGLDENTVVVYDNPPNVGGGQIIVTFDYVVKLMEEGCVQQDDQGQYVFVNGYSSADVIAANEELIETLNERAEGIEAANVLSSMSTIANEPSTSGLRSNEVILDNTYELVTSMENEPRPTAPVSRKRNRPNGPVRPITSPYIAEPGTRGTQLVEPPTSRQFKVRR